jgi:hypothetical protein
LKRDDPAVEEGNHIVSVKHFAFHVHPLVGFFFVIAESCSMYIVHDVMKSNRSGIRNDFISMSATSLIDNCFMVEFFGDRMNKSNKTGTVLSLELSPDVSD